MTVFLIKSVLAYFINKSRLEYPQAEYISKWNAEVLGILVLPSPMGDSAACIAGPTMNPMFWNIDKRAICVVRSFGYVAFETYSRFGATFATK